MTDVSRELDDLSIVERTSLEERLLERHALPAAAAIPRRPRSDPTPLSFAQQRLWFLEQLQPGTPLHNMSRVIRLKGVLDRAVLQQSLDAIVARHEVLRTRFVATNGIPEQIVSPPAPVTVAVTDLRGLAPGAREPEAQRLVADEARKPFDLVHGPLFRAMLLLLSADEHLLVLSMHHIISDGWSRQLLSGELTAFFNAFCSDKPAPVPELPIQYGDYAVWQRDWLRGERLERELAYWRNQLRGCPTLLDLPTDYSRPPVRSGRGAREHDRAASGSLRAAATAEPTRERDVVRHRARCLPNTSGPLHRAGRHLGGFSDRGPHSVGDRVVDRPVCQHPGSPHQSFR